MCACIKINPPAAEPTTREGFRGPVHRPGSMDSRTVSRRQK